MRAFDKIRAGLNEAIAHESGEIKAKTQKLSIEPVKGWSADEIRRIRLSVGFSQQVFAKALGVSTKTVEAWEAGRNTPSGPADRLLFMIQQDPECLERVNIIQR